MAAFKVTTQKSIFQHDFINQPEIDLNYNCLTPDIKYFNDISLEEYNNYKNSIKDLWNLRKQPMAWLVKNIVQLIVFHFMKL